MKHAKFLLFLAALSFALLSASGAEPAKKCLFAVVPALGGPTWEPTVTRIDEPTHLPRWFTEGELLSIEDLWIGLKDSGIRISLDPALSKKITLDREHLKVSGAGRTAIPFLTTKRAFGIYPRNRPNRLLATIFSYRQAVNQHFNLDVHFEPIAGTSISRRFVCGTGTFENFKVTEWMIVASAEDEIPKLAQSSAAALGGWLPSKEQSVTKEWQKFFDKIDPHQFEALTYDKSINILFVRASLTSMEDFVSDLGPL